jgi:hypothetical protein
MRQLLSIKPVMAGAAAEGFDEHEKVFPQFPPGAKNIGRSTVGAHTLVRHSVSLVVSFYSLWESGGFPGYSKINLKI